MSVWAIADLHLSFGVPNKEMDVFGNVWKDHHEKIKKNWEETISTEDLVLLAGDLSWGMHPDEAAPDLNWLEALPGTKVLIRGNHDFWWTSLSKVEKVLPPSVHIIQNNVYRWKGIAIGGARLWDTPEYSFGSSIDYKENVRENPLTKREELSEAEKIFLRELSRLELSLKCFLNDPIKLVMTHYPPIGAQLVDSRVSKILEHYGVQACVFGHLHNVKEKALPFGEKNGVRYVLTSCDYLQFAPIKIL